MNSEELQGLVKKLQSENTALKDQLESKNKRLNDVEEALVKKEKELVMALHLPKRDNNCRDGKPVTPNFGDEATQKRVEEMKRDHELILLRTLINHLPSSIFVIDKQYRKTVFNEAHLRRIEDTLNLPTRLTEADLLGKTNWDIYPKELADLYYEEDREVIENGLVIIERENFQIDRKGNQVRESISKIPMRDADGSIIGMLGIAHNITERKMVEHELVKAKEKASESDRLKSSFLAAMSHELRTPLNAVIGFSEMIEECMDVSEIHEMVKIINENGNNLLNIIESIFSLTLLQSNNLNVLSENIPLSNFINGLKPYLTTKLARDNKETLSLIVNSGLSEDEFVIRSDKTKLTQLMTKFFDNAIKYTKEGSIEYGCIVEGSSVTFYVKDTGIGIPSDKQDVIFERFRQIEDSLSRQYGGVGLGLAICKEISDLLNGKIWVESEKGEGSTFYFKLDDVVVK